mmetsp:Transcript_33656/g.99169  ORF Transcript_33656/g.99169 Transcript_33656/m.99169 type:complete len:543 (+) Transcript_33656:638-2266(+)
MISSDEFTDTTVDNEFDYEPIDFRLPHEYHHAQQRMQNVHLPSPIVRRDPAAKSSQWISRRNSFGSEPMNHHCSMHSQQSSLSQAPDQLNFPESLPSPPKLSHPAQPYHGHQGNRFFPPYKISDWRGNVYGASTQQSIHPSPPFSQMTEHVGVSAGSPPPNFTMPSSFYHHSSEMPQLPPAVLSAQSVFRHHHETGASQPHDPRMIWNSGLYSPCYEKDAGPIGSVGTSALSPFIQRPAPHMIVAPSSAVKCQSAHYLPSSSISPINYDGYGAGHATYNEHDVLCGRGGATNSHPGNRKFRSLVAAHRERYLKAKKRDKPAYAQHVVSLVRNQCPKQCRFLKKDTKSNKWYDIGDEKAREKVAQALREGAAQLRRDQKRKERDDGSDGSSSYGSSGALSGSQADDSKKRKRAIVEIEVVKFVKDESDHLSAQTESGNGERNPKHVSSYVYPSTVVFEGRDDAEESLFPPPSAFEERSEQRSISLTPITIRPNLKLTLKPPPFASVEDLSPSERSLYHRYFLPPRSQGQRGPRSGKQKVIRVR